MLVEAIVGTAQADVGGTDQGAALAGKGYHLMSD
jgi:hypothetical protein